MRDCENCARCGRDGCKSWDCDFIPRKEAIEAWKEKYGNTETFQAVDFGKGTVKYYNDDGEIDCPWK